MKVSAMTIEKMGAKLDISSEMLLASRLLSQASNTMFQEWYALNSCSGCLTDRYMSYQKIAELYNEERGAGTDSVLESL